MGMTREQQRAAIIQARREWGGKWVWFDPDDGTGLQKGIVSLINRLGEVYVSYDFDERGCYTLPICTIDDIAQVLVKA